MPTVYAITQNAYLLIVAAILITVTIVVIRLMLAATRALNAYADDRRLRTAMVLDEVDSQSSDATER